MKAWALRFRASLAEATPEQIALLISAGLLLGIFPIMGAPTVLCLLAAFLLRLNAAALQLLNNVSTPLQLALLLPLARAGAWLCGGRGSSSVSWTGKLGMAAMHAVAGWACICIPLAALLYVSLALFLRRSKFFQRDGLLGVYPN
jgi:uncharacterized protein (DUF2062 family)